MYIAKFTNHNSFLYTTRGRIEGDEHKFLRYEYHLSVTGFLRATNFLHLKRLLEPFFEYSAETYFLKRSFPIINV